MKLPLYFARAFLLLSLANIAHAQNNIERDIAYLDDLIRNGDIPQYQLSFIKSDGAVVNSRGHFANGIVPVDAVKADTVVSLLSMSKPITNLLALRLVQKGYLKLDDPVSKYLPSFKNMATREESNETQRQILVRDLMIHTAGFAQNSEFLGWGEVSNLYQTEGIFGLSCLAGKTKTSLGDVVNKMVGLPLKHKPGEKFSYSVATDVLGHILELATKKDFDSLLSDYLSKPLGLKSLTTKVTTPDVDVAQLYEPIYKSYPVPGAYQRYKPFAQFEVDVVNAGIEPGCISPGNGLVATMEDMIALAQFLLNDMQLDDGSEFLSNDLQRQVYTHQLNSKLGKSPLRSSLAYANKDGLTLGLLSIKIKADGDLADKTSHDYYYWSGFSGSGLWIDKKNNTAGIFLTQLYPSDKFLIPKLVAYTRDNFAR